jgi:hypothetical protein
LVRACVIIPLIKPTTKVNGMSFTKLDSGITDSTVWREPDRTRIVWITLLAMADQHGYVGAAVPGLADRARVPIEDCLLALERFKAPDEWSRSQEHDGRRIADAPGGWVLLNYGEYRKRMDADMRRERSKLAMRRLRAGKDGVSEKANTGQQKATVNNVGLGLPPLPQAEAEAEAEAETKEISKASPSQGAGKPPPVADDEGRFPDFWRAWPKTDRKQDRKKCLAKWRALKLDPHADGIIAHVSAMAATKKWKDGFDPLVLSYLNGERWNDPIPPDRPPTEPAWVQHRKGDAAKWGGGVRPASDDFIDMEATDAKPAIC